MSLSWKRRKARVSYLCPERLAGSVQTHANSSRRHLKYLGRLMRREFLDISKLDDDSIVLRELRNGLLHEPSPLGFRREFVRLPGFVRLRISSSRKRGLEPVYFVFT